MKEFREEMSKQTVMPRWIWYVLIAAALALVAIHIVNESRWRAYTTQYHINRGDINVNTERITLIENLLMIEGKMRPDEVREVRERLSQEAQERVTNAGKR